jgi:hypothetical protein
MFLSPCCRSPSFLSKYHLQGFPFTSPCLISNLILPRRNELIRSKQGAIMMYKWAGTRMWSISVVSPRLGSSNCQTLIHCVIVVGWVTLRVCRRGSGNSSGTLGGNSLPGFSDTTDNFWRPDGMRHNFVGNISLLAYTFSRVFQGLFCVRQVLGVCDRITNSQC